MNEKESDIVRAICEYLTHRRHFFWRNNTGAFRTEKGGMYFFGAKGSPDIFVVTRGGYLVSLEVKTQKGRQSPDQRVWEARCREIDAAYHVVRSIEDVQAIGL